MDSITTALLNFGIGGVMASAVVFLVWHNTTKTIPDLIKEVTTSRKEYLASLEAQEKNCSDEKTRIRDLWASKMDKLTDEFRSLRERIKP